MRKTLECIGEFLLGIVILAVMVFVVYIIGLGAFKFLKWLVTPVPQPVCYYKYVDVNGVEGTGTTCKRTWDNIYCGNDNDAHLVVSFEKVCE